MRLLTLLVLAALATSSPLIAGPVYGSIFFGDAAVKAAAITITCGEQTVKGATLDDGSYRITAPEGRCTFTVTSPTFGSASAAVVSSASAARYSFDVVKGGDGYELRRQ
jgi:Tfp pilus assembly major pilin PilA